MPRTEGERVPLAVPAFFALTLALLLPSLPEYAAVWSAQPYTQGWIVAPAAIWLVWRERSVFRHVRIWRAPLAAAAVVSMIWFLATIAQARVVALAAVPAVLFLWSAAVFGQNAARRLAPAAGMFLLGSTVLGCAHDAAPGSHGPRQRRTRALARHSLAGGWKHHPHHVRFFPGRRRLRRSQLLDGGADPRSALRRGVLSQPPIEGCQCWGSPPWLRSSATGSVWGR